MICLSLAIASAGRAMQRQSDNRHHLITQCMAFLSRYRALRGKDWEGMSEVEFNFGRMFQQLGLLSHAVKHYEHVLELAERGVTKVRCAYFAAQCNIDSNSVGGRMVGWREKRRIIYRLFM